MDVQKFKILLILGTAREGRFSERVARAVFNELGKRSDLEVVFADVRDFVFGATINGSDSDPRLTPWKKLVVSSDALFIVSPEYNHSYPGELKMLLDSAFLEYVKKPVAICGVSDGGFGGVRMIEMLRGLLSYLGMIPIPTVIPVSKVDEVFNESNEPQDPKFFDKVHKTTDELIEYIKLLKK